MQHHQEKPVFLIVFDYETTSAKPLTTRGVQFAAIGCELAEGATPEVLFNEVTNPEVGISPEAQKIHGFSQEDVADKRMDKVVAVEFAEFVTKKAETHTVILSGHYSTSFDLVILKRLSGMELDGILHIDTHVAALRLLPNAPNHKLSCDDPKKGQGLTQSLGLGTGEGAHDALADTRMVWAFIEYICKELGQSPYELAQWLAIPRVLQICHMGKNKGLHWKDVSAGFIWWMTENFESPSPDLRATIWHWHRRKFKN